MHGGMAERARADFVGQSRAQKAAIVAAVLRAMIIWPGRLPALYRKSNSCSSNMGIIMYCHIIASERQGHHWSPPPTGASAIEVALSARRAGRLRRPAARHCLLRARAMAHALASAFGDAGDFDAANTAAASLI